MAEELTDRTAAAVAAPRSIEERYSVRNIEHRTSAIVEVWLRPLVGPLEYLPAEYCRAADAAR
jgi:hypothetical protein